MWFKRKKTEGQSGGTGKVSAKDQTINSEFILNAIEDGVVMVGADNIIRLFNPAAATITGWRASEALSLEYNSVLQLADENGNQLQPQTNPFTIQIGRAHV